MILTGGLLPFVLLLIEWIYWSSSSHALTRPIQIWGVLANLLNGSLGALMQGGPPDLTISAMPNYFVVLAFGFVTLIICSSYTANLAAFLSSTQLNVSLVYYVPRYSYLMVQM